MHNYVKRQVKKYNSYYKYDIDYVDLTKYVASTSEQCFINVKKKLSKASIFC